MLWVILLGAGIGLAAGAMIGRKAKCQSDTCPLTGNPYSGALMGAVLGGIVAAAFSTNCSSKSPPSPAGNEVTVATPEQFRTVVLEARQPVLVDFFATWCGPCKAQAPMIDKLSQDYKGKVLFVRVDGDRSPELMRANQVNGFPTVVLFLGGRERERWIGWEGPQSEGKYRKALDDAVADTPPATTQPITKEKDMTPQTSATLESIRSERPGAVTMKGHPLTLIGPELKVGDKAPDFYVMDNDLKETRLSDFRGRICVISSVPSLDTPVCDRETRRFNLEASRLGDDVAILTISMDLPFAQKRWCAAAGIDKVKTYSDYKEASFGTAFGTLIKELRLLARAVFVVDEDGAIRYVQWVREITSEPDYDQVLQAVGQVKKS